VRLRRYWDTAMEQNYAMFIHFLKNFDFSSSSSLLN
jgi:hypothetical protein